MNTGPFSAKVMAVVITVGVFAFAAFFVLSAYAPELRRGSDGGAHALSKSAVGFAAARRLMEARGDTVLVSRSGEAPRAQAASPEARSERVGAPSPPILSVGPALWIATPGTTTTGATREALNTYVDRREAPILLVLPKWSVEPRPNRPGWVNKAGLLNPGVAVSPMLIFNDVSASVVRRSGASNVRLVDETGLGEPAGAIESLQVLQGEGFAPIITDGQGGVVLAYVVNRRTYVLSDPDLLNTQGLAELQTARAALRIVDWARLVEHQGPIVFDVSLNGFASGRNLLKLAFSPPFLAATLCAAAAAALAAWQAAVRFGPRVRTGRAVALGAEALTENAAALIRLSGREHRMAERYAALVEARAVKAAAAPAGEAGPYLDGLGRSRPGLARWSGLREEARAVRTRDALVGIARRMHRWKGEVTGG